MTSTIRTIRYTEWLRTRCCAMPFVVWFRERSGSTFFCSMLDSHPKIHCRKEDFDLIPAEPTEENADIIKFKHKHYRRRIDGYDGYLVDPSPQQAIDHMRSVLGKKHHHACGFKLKFDIQVACYPEIVDELHWIMRRLRVMLLTRKNILKQAVSRENMKRIQQAQNDSNLRTNHRMPRFQIDVAEVVHYANCLQTLNDRFNKSVRGFVNVKTIVYEDLLSDPRNEMKEVLQFLRMNPNTELVPTTYKATPDRLSEAVENYDELVTAVSGTQLEQFLD